MFPASINNYCPYCCHWSCMSREINLHSQSKNGCIYCSYRKSTSLHTCTHTHTHTCTHAHARTHARTHTHTLLTSAELSHNLILCTVLGLPVDKEYLWCFWRTACSSQQQQMSPFRHFVVLKLAQPVKPSHVDVTYSRTGHVDIFDKWCGQ